MPLLTLFEQISRVWRLNSLPGQHNFFRVFSWVVSDLISTFFRSGQPLAFTRIGSQSTFAYNNMFDLQMISE